MTKSGRPNRRARGYTRALHARVRARHTDREAIADNVTNQLKPLQLVLIQVLRNQLLMTDPLKGERLELNIKVMRAETRQVLRDIAK